MRITNLLLGPILVFSLTALVIQPTISSSDIAANASMETSSSQLSRMTARGTRSENCCSKFSTIFTNSISFSQIDSPRRGLMRSTYEEPTDTVEDYAIWNERRGTRVSDAS